LKGGSGTMTDRKSVIINPDAYIWDLQVEHQQVNYTLRDVDILKVKKPFFKMRLGRIPTLEKESFYCRYCRFNLSDTTMNMEYYVNLFPKKNQHIDPDDKRYVINLFSEKNEFGIPNPKIFELCPNCYRPYKVFDDGTKDVLTRSMFVFELVSYLVFQIFVWPILLIIFLVPAVFVQIAVGFKKLIQKTQDDDTKSFHGRRMHRSEPNDSYREKVRQVSEQEEKMPQIVKRIDYNVTRLERVIKGYDEHNTNTNINLDAPGNAPPVDDTVRADEIDKKVEKIRKEMHARFDEFKKSLQILGVKTI